MRIGVDATCWHNKRGYGRHARALLRALTGMDRENRYTLLLDSAECGEPIPETCETRLLRSSVPTVPDALRCKRRTFLEHNGRARGAAMGSPTPGNDEGRASSRCPAFSCKPCAGK